MVARALSILISLSLLNACGSGSPTAPTSAGTDFISLDSIVPQPGTILTAGERVTFTAVVTCTIVSAEGGLTALLLQDQRNVTLLGSDERPPEAALRKGTVTLTLTDTITIPASGSTVNALFPLFVTGSNVTRAVAVRSYSVR